MHKLDTLRTSTVTEAIEVIKATFTVLADMPTSKFPSGENHEKNCPKTEEIGGKQEDFRL